MTAEVGERPVHRECDLIRMRDEGQFFKRQNRPGSEDTEERNMTRKTKGNVENSSTNSRTDELGRRRTALRDKRGRQRLPHPHRRQRDRHGGELADRHGGELTDGPSIRTDFRTEQAAVTIVGIDSRPVKKWTTRGWWWSAGLVDGFLRRRSASRYRVWRQRKNHPENA